MCSVDYVECLWHSATLLTDLGTTHIETGKIRINILNIYLVYAARKLIT